MSDAPSPSPCPDCGGALVAVKLFWRNAQGEVEKVFYTDVHARRSFWSSRLPVSGLVEAALCVNCRRIFLHGVRDPDARSCRKCGYDLSHRAETGHCPECGYLAE